MNWKLLGDSFMLLAACALIPFPFLYHYETGGAWLRTRMGPHLMSFMGVMAVVMCFAVANFFWPPLPPFIRPMVWFLISVVSVWRLVLLYDVQRHPKRDRADA